jgi:TolB-like protein/class 3 adenylate cyclase
MVQERPVRVERRLSAILAADVAGYSRLMHSDEEATHARLTALLVEAIHPAIAEHGGRIVKNTGDGFLAEFLSAVEAVRAALQFQTSVNDLTIGDAEDKRIAFRVGINIGDVIVEPHDIFGDGVNIAARLESIAEPGGICISSSAYDHVRGKLNIEFVDLGEQNLKNIGRPIRAYASIARTRDSATFADRIGGTSLSPPRLSIVVLPFANLNGDPEQEYFADGVTESLTTDLSRIRDSFVVARNSAFSYKGKSIDIRQVGRELNIRYVLEGSVQRSGNRLRLNVQLVDALTGNHLWAERFDKPLADLLDMQDEIVARLARTLGNQLIVAEARRAERSLHPDARDLNFRGMACIFKGAALEQMIKARGLFEGAFAIDSESVTALVGMAMVDLLMAAELLSDNRPALFASAETNVIRALSLVPDNAVAHSILGTIQILTNRAAQGIAECEQALALDHNLASTHAVIGLAKFYMGRGRETEGHIVEAFRLSPRDSEAFRWMRFAGVAMLQIGDDAAAAAWLRRSIETNRNHSLSHFSLAAALGLLGMQEEARAAATAGLALYPDFTICRFRSVTESSDHPTYLAGVERTCEGMRIAGVPDR